MKWSEKPVIVIGHGCTGVDLSPLLKLNVPIVSSWQAADLIDNFHPLYFGRPGIYGQRTANKVMYEADQLLVLGCRLSKWMIGHGGLRKEQTLVMVDVDGNEVAKFPQADWVRMALKPFINTLEPIDSAWSIVCRGWRVPLIEACHADTKYINSYRVIELLEKRLKKDAVICVDVGSLMCPVFQVLRLRPPQRLMTSGGLGEMGCAMPAAVGASFARDKGEVLALVGDGGMMMNLQELATIWHHQLPIKIIVFSNDGYSMIKGTYANMNLPRQGVDKASGLSFPSFRQVAQAWGMKACDVWTWEDFDNGMGSLLSNAGPALMEIHIDPEQQYVPRLQPTVKDGKITPARFDRLSPLMEADYA